MSDKEKILLIQLLLEDIRGNWGWENNDRRELALDLTKELRLNRINTLAYSIERYETGDDGRCFRCDYPYGYEGMSELHGLTKTFQDKSDGFKALAKAYLTYPESRFSDYDE